MIKRTGVFIICLFLSVFCAEPSRETDAPIARSTAGQTKLAAQLEMIDRFETALETAPIYSSEIRSSLIDSPFSHRASYRGGSADFLDLPKEFGCPHDARIIDTLISQQWQIVKCEYSSATFFRRHSEAHDERRRCFDGIAGARKKDLGDEYETLIVSFQTFYPEDAEERSDMKTFMYRRSNYLWGQPTQSADLEPFFPLGEFEKAEFYAKDWIKFISFYVLDEKRDRLVQFDLRPADKCKRNPMGWARSRDHSVELDSPQPSVRAMDEALSAIISLLDS